MPISYTYDETIPRPNSGNVWSLELGQSIVYCGGSFSDLGGQPRINLAAFDITTKAVTAFNPGILGGAPIVDILYLNGVIYIAALGAIVFPGGVVRQGFAAVDTSGNLLPWNPDTSGTPGRTLDTDGVNIFIGGEFTSLNGGGVLRNRIARVDAVNGIPDSFDPDMNGAVYGIKWDNASSMLFATGSFTTAGGGTARNRAASFDASGALQAWDPDIVDGQGNSVEVRAGKVYVGGTFSVVNGATVRWGLAVFDDTVGTVDAEDFGITSNSPVNVVKYNLANNYLYVGGSFGTVQGVEPEGMITLDLNTGLLVFPTSFSGPGLDFIFSATYVIVCGFFNIFRGDFYAPRFGSYNYGTDEYVNPGEFDSFGPESIAWDSAGGIIYLSGAYSTATGDNGAFARTNLAAFDLNRNVLAWNPSVSNVGPSTSQGRKIVYDAGTIYVGGVFERANGILRQGFAAFDTAGALLPLDLGLDRGFGLIVDVQDFAVDATHIYVAGNYLTVNGGTAQPYLARFDKSTGVYDATWVPTFPVAGIGVSPVQAIALNSTMLYIGGGFATVTGVPLVNVARIPIGGVGAPDAGWVYDTDSSVRTITLTSPGAPQDIYIGGDFTTVNGTPQPGVARIRYFGALYPSFGDTVNPTNSSSITKLYWYGTEIFIAGSNKYAGTGDLYVNGTMVATYSVGDIQTWFLPRPIGQVTDFLAAAGRLFFIGGWEYLFTNDAKGGLAAFYTPALPPENVPQAPKIRFLNRRTLQGGADTRPITVLRWNPVVRDTLNNPVSVSSYKIYRTASKNQEDPTLIATITTRDRSGQVDTIFTEQIEGFYKYCVSAVNAAGESGKSCIAFVETQQLDRLV